MEARTSASIFLSLTLFCATLSAQQFDYYQAPAPASDALEGGGVGQYITGPAFEGACGGCATTCGCCCFPDACCPDCLGFCETITESIFGHPDPCCWCPLSLSTLFSEGWRQPWVPSPNGSGGAPRQGWINAADGNMYRLNFLTFAQAFKSGPQDDAYLGAYTLYTPLSRRLLLITNVPFTLFNSVGGGQPTIEPEGSVTATTRNQLTFGDVSFTPRVLLHETQDFSVTSTSRW